MDWGNVIDFACDRLGVAFGVLTGEYDILDRLCRIGVSWTPSVRGEMVAIMSLLGVAML